MQVSFFRERSDADVVHIVFALFAAVFLVPRFQDMIDESLECARGITHPEKHDFWFEKSSAGFKRSLPLVFLSNANIVIAPANVKFAVYLHALEIFYTLGQTGERGDVSSSYFVQWSVVDNVPHFVTVFLWDLERCKSVRRFRGHDVAFLDVLI